MDVPLAVESVLIDTLSVFISATTPLFYYAFTLFLSLCGPHLPSPAGALRQSYQAFVLVL